MSAEKLVAGINLRPEENMETQADCSGANGQWSDRWVAEKVQIPQQKVVGIILLALCFSHLLNDTIQSLIPAIYPVLKSSFRLNFGQIGLITLTFQLTSSLLQPLVGVYTDRSPKPFSLAIGMAVSLCGLLLLSRAWNFSIILVAAGLVGVGSSIFHPEAFRLARFTSGGRHGFAQSVFQLGAIWARRSDQRSRQWLWFRRDNKALPGFR